MLCVLVLLFFFFFFKQKTAYEMRISDWSSDVCSSDLLMTGRREDRVLFDLQPGLAATYGFEATRNRRPSELLMQRYYWAARVVSQLNTILMQSIEELLFPLPDDQVRVIDDDFCMVRGRLGLCRDDGFERNPALLLRAFLVMQERPEIVGISGQALRAMWHARRRIRSEEHTSELQSLMRISYAVFCLQKKTKQ